MSREHIPTVSPFLIKHLRERREWQDRLPDPDWDRDQIQRAIGANEVIQHLIRLEEGGGD